MARQLYLDVENQSFVRDPKSGAPVSLANLFEGDLEDYELYFVRPGDNGAPPYSFVNKQDSSVKLHIGPPPPISASPYVAQATWTNIASWITGITASVTRTASGGISVNEQQKIVLDPAPESGSFNITFPQRTLAITAFSATETFGPLLIDSSVTAAVFRTATPHGLVNGDSIVLSGFNAPVGFDNDVIYPAARYSEDTFGILPLAFRAASSISGAQITVLPQTTASIDVRDLNALAIKIILENTPSSNANSGNFGVFVGFTGALVAPASVIIVITYQGLKGRASFPLLMLDGQNLNRRFGKTASLNFNTVELATALSGRATLDAVLEVETSEGGKIDTVAQMPVVLKQDIIKSGTPSPVSTISGSTSFNILSPDASVWTITIDDNGILTATKQ
jgi:hypothetical protein